jgi:hypothetical protein
MFGKIHTIETRKNCRIVKAHLWLCIMIIINIY